jgi:hypothetical protein
MIDLLLMFAGAAVAVVLIFMLSRGSSGDQKLPGVRPRPSSRGVAAPPLAPIAQDLRLPPGQEPLDKFRGGMIFPQPDACEAVCKLRGKTFPEGQVPAVPVAGCFRQRCDCQVHVVVGRRRGSRRTNSDRREDLRIDEERRLGQDRRAH